MEKDFWGKKISFLIVLSKHLWLKGKFSDTAIQRRIVHIFGQEKGYRDNVGIAPLADREAFEKSKVSIVIESWSGRRILVIMIRLFPLFVC